MRLSSLGLTSMASIIMMITLSAACTSEVTVFGGMGSGGGLAAQGSGGDSSGDSSVGQGGVNGDSSVVQVASSSTGQSVTVSSAVGSGVGGSTTASTAASTATSAASTAASTATNAASAAATAATSAASTAATVASSSSTGGGSNCAHDPCKAGVSLDPNCDPCVQQICQFDQFCCSQNGAWDLLCAYYVDTVCMKKCPNDPNVGDCNTLYGNAPNFQLCYQSGVTCEFALNTQNNNSCDAICKAGGGECIGLMNDLNNQACAKPQNANFSPNACGSTQLSSGICACTRGCGGGPACSGGQTCNDGVCS